MQLFLIEKIIWSKKFGSLSQLKIFCWWIAKTKFGFTEISQNVVKELGFV